MINDANPTSWRDLQNQVSFILTETGVQSEVEKKVVNVRGKAEIDVWAHDAKSVPPQTYLIECKNWTDPVSQTIVHGFRTLVGDSGANWGAIVSKNGFQKGAHEAAEYTNVRLLTWSQFQEMFLEPWLTNFFGPQLHQFCDPLVEYIEPVNQRIFRKADSLEPEQRKEFARLRDEHQALGSFCSLMIGFQLGANVMPKLKDLVLPVPTPPLKAISGRRRAQNGFKSSSVDFRCYKLSRSSRKYFT